jgi:hypothetical protein
MSTKGSQLTGASTLTGPEIVIGVQSGNSRKITAAQFFSSNLFTQTGTGAVARSPNSKMGDIVSVKDFGAAGDGTTDDTTAVQAAVNTGRGIWFPNGTYKLTSVLTVSTADTQMLGESWAAIITQSSASAVNTITVSGSRVHISNLKIVGNGVHSGTTATMNGIYVVGADDVTIDNCWVDNASLCGIQAGGAINRLTISNNKITTTNTAASETNSADIYVGNQISAGADIWIKNNRCLSIHKGLGIALQPSTATIERCVIVDNLIDTSDQITGLVGHGIMLYATNNASFMKSVSIRGNIIKGTEGIGIYLKGLASPDDVIQGISVVENKLIGCCTVGTSGSIEDSAIGLTGAKGAFIAGNYITGSGGAVSTTQGIRVAENNDGANLIGNSFKNWPHQAIKITSSVGIKVIDNSISGTFNQGIWVIGGTEHIIEGNYIDGSSNDAILFQTAACTNSIVSRNVTKNSTSAVGITIGAGVGPITVEHNRFVEGAVSDAGTGNTFRRNRLSTGATQGRAVMTNGTVTVNTTEIKASDNVLLTRVVGTSTTRGILTVGTIVAATSFVIRAEDLVGTLSADDDSTVFWEIVH